MPIKNKKAREVKPAYSFATVKNGQINWVAQPGMGSSKSKLVKFTKAFGEEVIRVSIKEIK